MKTQRIGMSLLLFFGSQLSFAGKQLPFNDMKKFFKNSFSVTKDEGEIALAEGCRLTFKFQSSSSSYQTLELKMSSGKKVVNYYISNSDVAEVFLNSKNQVTGFLYTQEIGLDCETQGCISYADIQFRLQDKTITLQDRSDYDPIEYASIETLTCHK